MSDFKKILICAQWTVYWLAVASGEMKNEKHRN